MVVIGGIRYVIWRAQCRDRTEEEKSYVQRGPRARGGAGKGGGPLPLILLSFFSFFCAPIMPRRKASLGVLALAAADAWKEEGRIPARRLTRVPHAELIAADAGSRSLRRRSCKKTVREMTKMPHASGRKAIAWARRPEKRWPVPTWEMHAMRIG